MKQILKRPGRFLLLIISFLIISCDNSDNPLAPYAGSPELSGITVQTGTFNPKITWIGGYVSVLGINRGGHAALDTSLVWLIHSSGNQIKYPVTYGSLPEGAQDLTSQFGGVTESELTEDRNYTFWVMKEEAWNQISNSTNKILQVDSVSESLTTDGDTLLIPSIYHTQLNQNFDNYVNIYEVVNRGPLADFTIIQTDTGDSPIIIWTMKIAGYDSAVAAVGIVEGSQYALDRALWELYSEDIVGGQPVYGKSNKITPPVNPYDEPEGTKTFYYFPLTGLARNTEYYVWIAGKDWNGTDRFFNSPHYAYVRFKTR
jgi:hypothetical protein